MSAPPPEPLGKRAIGVISLPRLAFTDNWSCAQQEFAKLGMALMHGCGAYWHHSICRMMNEAALSGFEYVITLDYDTVFYAQQIQELVRLMDENPEAFAIWSAQMRQHDDVILCGLYHENGKPKRYAPVDEFVGDLTEATAGHFGLTIIRCAMLARLEKPWMKEQPDKNGGWEHGRIDPDWSFWTRAKAIGMKLYQANRVRIGHMQTVVTWPGDDFLPVHQYLLDWRENGPPAPVHPFPGMSEMRPQLGRYRKYAFRPPVPIEGETPSHAAPSDDKVRLNIGSGEGDIPGFTAIDRKFGTEAYPLDYADNSVDEIRASHILEHFGFREVPLVVKDWIRVLKPGGVLKIAVPDFDYIINSYQTGNGMPWPAFLFGAQGDENDFHKVPFTEKELTRLMVQSGLDKICRWTSEVRDCASYEVSLNLQGVKPSLPDPAEDVAPPTDVAPPAPAELPDTAWLADKASNTHSQFGEDGVLAAIFETIGTRNKWCFEAGASDGVWLSNTRLLGEQGWTRVLVENDPDMYKQLEQKALPNDKAVFATLTPTGDFSLDAILSRHGAPLDLDYLSIDVDGNECDIWKAMRGHSPQVVSIEHVANGVKQTEEVVHTGSLMGYIPVFESQVNIIFVRMDLIDRLRYPTGSGE